jgi:hypothetical protein
MECIDADGCSETDYEAQYDYDLDAETLESAASAATRSDVTGTAAGLMATRNEILRFSAGAYFEGMEETLTVAPGGEARLVVMLAEVPMLLSYTGTCQSIESE